MNFFLLDGSPEARDEKAFMVGGELIRFMDGMRVGLEADGDRSKALKELVVVLADGDKNSAEIPGVIDKHYKFSDEAQGE